MEQEANFSCACDMFDAEGSVANEAYNCCNRCPESMTLYDCTSMYLHGIIYSHPCSHGAARRVDEKLDVL